MQDVTIDACCLINLCAAASILSPPSPAKGAKKKAAQDAPSGLGLKLHVPTKVTEEALYLLQPEQADASQVVKVELDLSGYTNSGVLHPCDLEGEEETNLFVELAMDLDDGEAACLAIAKTRGWWMLTDDRKGIRIAGENGVKVLTTPEIVKSWADATGASDEEIATVLQNIDRFACYQPRKSSAQYPWWMRLWNK